MEKNATMPILVPVEPGEFWKQIRHIVRDELQVAINSKKNGPGELDVPGLTQKPLYKINDICKLFNITRPTIYEWVKAGKLRPVKIRSRVYFLGSEVEQLIAP